MQAIACQYTMLWQTTSRFYLRYYSQPWGSNSELHVKQTCILSGWIARTDITGCNNHSKCSQLLCCPAKMNSAISKSSSSDSHVMRQGCIIINYTYTVKPRYSFTVCSQQFVAVYREWRHIDGGPISGFHCTVCPTRYGTQHIFNNFTTNDDIATKFEADLPHCVRNVTTS